MKEKKFLSNFDEKQNEQNFIFFLFIQFFIKKNYSILHKKIIHLFSFVETSPILFILFSSII